MMTRAGDGEDAAAGRHVVAGEIGDRRQAERLQLRRRSAADAPDFIERDGGIETLAGCRVAQIADAGEFRPLLGEKIGQLGFRLCLADANAGRDFRLLQDGRADSAAVVDQVDT